jgi:PAS domain S-box-containing protein
MRVIWGNPAGIDYFGGETVFDLLDRPFDTVEPGVEQIVALGNSLKRGEERRVFLHFPSSGNEAPLSCRCFVHSLSDGRPGLLVIASADHGREAAKPSALAQAFDHLPLAALLLEGAQITHANLAANRLFTPAQRSSLVGLLGDVKAAQDLLNRLEASGSLSLTRRLATSYGEREVKITAKMAAKGEPAVLLFDDVTERRAIERKLAAANESDLPPLSADESDLFVALGRALRPPSEKPAAPAQPKVSAVNIPALPFAVTGKIDSLPRATVIVQNDKIQYANSKALKLLRYPDLASLIARNEIASLASSESSSGEATLPCGDGKSAPLAFTATAIAWRSGPATQLTFTMPQPQPSEMPAPAVKPVAKPIIAEKADNLVPLPISRRDEALERRREVSDDELRAVLDTAADGIVTLDDEGRIHSLSAGAEAIFGYRNAEVADRPLADFLTLESRKILREYLSALQGPGLASIFNDGREVTGVVKQGGEVPLFLTIGKLQKTRPQGAAFCAVLRDITQWKRTESDLRGAKEAAEQASRQKSEFLAKISHELRTPLNAILGFSEVMRLERFGEIRNEKYRGYVNDIHASGAHLLSLINDLLDLSKVEAGKLELNFTSVNLAEVLEHSLKLMQEQATAARVILRKNLPQNLPNIVADLRSMRQIMLNLLSNGIKFTDPGGQVIVSAQMTPVGELKLSVKDTGLGMTEAEIKQALEPFQRVTTEGRDVPGTGLGLPLTKALAEANRASFAITSEPHKGTLVQITFPTTRVLAE